MGFRPRRVRPAPWAILFLTVVGPSGPAGGLDASSVLAELSAADRSSLEAGDLVLPDVSGDARFVIGLVIFEQPAEDALRLLAQTGRQIEYRPELKRNDTLETYPDGTLERQQLKIMFNKIVYHLRYTTDPVAGRVSWELDPGHENDLVEVTGFWEVYPLSAGRSLGRMGTRVDVGALPAFLQDYATRKNVPRSLENTRRWIDSGGVWRP